MKARTINYPMSERDFRNAIRNSFKEFLEVGTSRSNAKLKYLHGPIARDLQMKLGHDFKIKSQGVGDDKEGTINGRYIDKKVDITIYKDRNPIAGIAVKFVMQNYKQNSNNYFENMLGETANIRCEHIPYFQVFIIFDKLPYYDNNGVLTHWEYFNDTNSHKYLILSKDDADSYYHTPDKTLLYILHIPENDSLLGENKREYISYYNNLNFEIEVSDSYVGELGSSIIKNNWVNFRDKVYHKILSL